MTIELDSRLRIDIDQQEKQPWSFPPDVAVCQRVHLKTADYAITGDTDFAIERKSLEDFVQTVSSGWSRFGREIDRMDGWPAKVIIVEGVFSSLVWGVENGEIKPPAHSHYRITPGFVMKRMASLTMRGVSILFAENPDYAAGLAYRILRARNVQILMKGGHVNG